MSVLCQSCEQQPARVHITQITPNQRVHVHLCIECARNHGLLGDTPTVMDALDAAFQASSPAQECVADAAALTFCPGCGASLHSFRQTGKVGCAQCYNSFRDQLMDVVSRTQYATCHVGKAPPGLRLAVRSDNLEAEFSRQVSELRQQLRQALHLGDWHLATRIRHEIRQLRAGRDEAS